MTNHAHCRFCAISAGFTFHGNVDHPIFDNGSYFAIASIGALVEGWTLVVPHAHDFSLRKDYKNSAFKDAVHQVVSKVERVYGPSVLFEHGASHQGSLTSCGTDHAHLHIVPLNFSLLPEILQNDLEWNEVSVSSLASIPEHTEYLFYSENTNSDLRGFLHILEEPISQYFRKLIASRLNKLSEADYKQHLHLQNSQHTQIRLTSDL